MAEQRSRTARTSARRSRRRWLALTLAAGSTLGVVATTTTITPASASLPAPGQDFQVTEHDLEFILDQIHIAEAHAEDVAGPGGDPNSSPLCQNGTFDDAEQLWFDDDGDPCVGAPLNSEGLRTVSGRWNNLLPGQDGYGASERAFPRLAPAQYQNADPIPPGFPGAGTATSYNDTTPGHFVFDDQIREISNLIVDQTSDNPAAIAACGTSPDCTSQPLVPVSRINGPDRFATAVEISKSFFAPGTPAAFIATGLNFPDALAGAAAAASAYGPVLLTNRDTLPAVTQAELARLAPGRIVVLGGPGVVSAAVLTQLDAFTTGAVTRLAGTNRYETAVEISKTFDPAATTKAYIATGANFPDALAIGAVAARDNAPVLLVPPGNTLPAIVAAELDRLTLDEIIIVGGPGVVSAAVQTALGAHAPTVSRLAGANRYETAAAIVGASFTEPFQPMFIATGGNFPDALAGGPVAGLRGIPLMLSPTAMPVGAVVSDAIARLKPASISLLGGPVALSDAVMGAIQGQFDTQELFIPNVAPDLGLSAPFSSWLTIFGQFFDHGLDLVNKGGNGQIIVPLHPDDPLYVEGSHTNFLVLDRVTNFDNREQHNKTTPFVDQNQTYTSNPSHQVFLREYSLVNGVPEATGKLLEQAVVGGLATWRDVKEQARTMLGIELDDLDVVAVPAVATDPYGHFVPGPNGFPVYPLVAGGTIEGNPANPVDASLVVKVGQAFIDDIAHEASPLSSDGRVRPGPNNPPAADPDLSPYDPELLNDHFITGDGRGNENIALSAVHHVFHSEHNRMADNIRAILNLPGNEQLLADYSTAGWWDLNERIFQAARFVTEMEYQHLVFEEFARRISPNIDPAPVAASGYNPAINPAIVAEFAHVVYRFGHSMLTQEIAREMPDGSDGSVRLFDGFLNPRLFSNGGTLTPDEAAGAIIKGMSQQVGNEIDEFVVPTLRNQLLGLPLDLPAINMMRGRDAGMPSLQRARQVFFDATGQVELQPYASWNQFRLALRHDASIVNFVAAYGIHPTLQAATTLVQKRAAAEALVANPTFMNGNAGLDTIDLWVGGLAEDNPDFGGMLGPTMNFVFELQLENLQAGDRFYYLTRNQGQDLFSLLEQNSFAELIERNTGAKDVSFDVFGIPNHRYHVADLQAGNVPPEIIQDIDGTWRFVGLDHINFYGTPANDRMQGDRGDDVIWGRAGNDRLEGGQGNDGIIGGDGDDLITDLFGIDTVLGGGGNDSIFIGGGAGDLVLAGSGKDYVNAGTDAKETFGGLGDDFVLGSSGDDGIQGNRGDDWIEGRAGADGLNGDNVNPFDNDPNGGHDVLQGNDGNTGYVGDGGDDIMFGTVGADAFDGDLGFDWVIFKGHPTAVDADMNVGEFVPPVPGVVLDQWNLTEGVSGAEGDDIIRGMEQPQDADPTFGAVGTGQRLTQDQLDRIPGLRALLSTGGVAQPVPDYAIPFLFGEAVDPGDFNSNILLGGPGNDMIEPRAGRNFADGDAWLNARIEWRPAGGPVESADSLTAFDARIRTGAINPGDLHIVREILQLTNVAADTDVLLVPGLAADNPIVNIEPGVWQLTYNDGLGGTTVFRNFEEVEYEDVTVCLGPTTTVACGAGEATGTVTIAADTAPAVQQGSVITTSDTLDDPDGLGAFLYSLQSFDGVAWTTLQSNDTGQFTLDQTNVGANVRVMISFTDGDDNPESMASNELGPVTDVDDPPVAPVIQAINGNLFPTGVVELLTPPTDADGIQGDPAYQWQASPDGGTTWNNIAGAVPLGLTDAHAGNLLRLQASFTDGLGNAVVIESNELGPVGA